MEVTVGDNTYRIGKLPAMTQFHVVRRIGPVLASMGVSITEMAASGKSLRNDGDLLSIMGTVSDVVARMSNEDVEYVIYSCLEVVKRQQGERFMPVMTGRTNFQFQDIGMDTMLRLTIEVLKENLGNFFPVPPGEPSTPTA